MQVETAGDPSPSDAATPSGAAKCEFVQPAVYTGPQCKCPTTSTCYIMCCNDAVEIIALITSDAIDDVNALNVTATTNLCGAFPFLAEEVEVRQCFVVNNWSSHVQCEAGRYLTTTCCV